MHFHKQKPHTDETIYGAYLIFKELRAFEIRNANIKKRVESIEKDLESSTFKESLPATVKPYVRPTSRDTVPILDSVEKYLVEVAAQLDHKISDKPRRLRKVKQLARTVSIRMDMNNGQGPRTSSKYANKYAYKKPQHMSLEAAMDRIEKALIVVTELLNVLNGIEQKPVMKKKWKLTNSDIKQLRGEIEQLKKDIDMLEELEALLE